MLFKLKDFIMHSGGQGKYKIECDALTEEDWNTIAYIISEKIDFKHARGVPTGGLHLERALHRYRNPNSNTLLIVDDVLTTGKSMEDFKYVLENTYKFYIRGVVLFARKECPGWITPIFQMWK